MNVDLTWKRKYWELIARHELLLQKRNDSEYAPADWRGLITEVRAHGMWALANDIQRELNLSTINIREE